MRWFESLRHDLAYAIRALVRVPGFALALPARKATGIEPIVALRCE